MQTVDKQEFTQTVMGVDCSELLQKKVYVLDMDGTVYLGNRIIEGSLTFIEKLRQRGTRFLFFTNNSSRGAGFYRNKLSAMGCEVNERDVMTSGDVTIAWLQQHRPNASVYLMGTPLLEESFRQAGIRLVQERPDEVPSNQSVPDIVVVGFDMTLDFEKVTRACTYIRQGAEFIATHPDLNCPTEEGFIPDCGAMCAMITASTGVLPRYLGKPYSETVEMICRVTGTEKQDMVFVGDRLYTDIAIGVNHGVTAILVLSGETRPEDLEKSEIRPDYVFNSLGELARWI